MKNLLVACLILLNLSLMGFLFRRELFRGDNSFREISLKDASGVPYAYIGLRDGVPTFALLDSMQKPKIALKGGEIASIELFDKNESPSIELSMEEGAGRMNLRDSKGKSRLQALAGALPALVLRGENDEVIGSLLTIEDGGGGLGLADASGEVASYLRGGENPTLNFFHSREEPSVSLGIAKGIPHILLTNSQNREGMLMHGGSPTSLLFMNEEGKIPVIISKHGFYQEKKEKEKKSPNKSEDKTIIKK